MIFALRKSCRHEYFGEAKNILSTICLSRSLQELYTFRIGVPTLKVLRSDNIASHSKKVFSHKFVLSYLYVSEKYRTLRIQKFRQKKRVTFFFQHFSYRRTEWLGQKQHCRGFSICLG